MGEPAKLVEVESLSFAHEKGDQAQQILQDVSLHISAGEVTVLTGPSGSGKSTLLTIVGGLRSAFEGSVSVLGTELIGASSATLVETRRRIGFVFQQHNLSDALTVAQNIQMGLQHSGGHRHSDAKERITEIATHLGIGEHLKKYPEQLSGGQQQRAGIARALVARPRLVLADEPTASLDKRTGESVMALFDELASAGGAVVLVTHDKRILDQADRVLSLEDGKVVSTADVMIEDAGKVLGKLMASEPDRLKRLLGYAHGLAQVALADGEVVYEERAVIRQSLLDRGVLQVRELDLVMELALAQADVLGKGHLASEDREQLAAALRDVAEADSQVVDSELRTIEKLLSDSG
ncbi:MAG: ATP-binding cassette domain-containing protein [Pseudomonadota bacterium]